jgi:glycosyltransferase involved in cell wall biosynthesis
MKNKLAYLCSSLSWGGLEMNQLRNALWMKERGHKVVFLAVKEAPAYKAAVNAGLATRAIHRHKKYYDFKSGRTLAKILERECVSHLIIRDTRDMSVSVIAKRRCSHKVHLSYFMEMQLGVKKTHLLHSIRFRNIDLWSCPLNWLADQVRTMTHFPSERIAVISSGLELKKAMSTYSKAESRKIMDLPLDLKIIGLVGRFDVQKGQMVLLEALSKLEDKEVAVCLLGEPTIGEGEAYSHEINTFIDTNHLTNRVFIRPFRSDVSTFFRAVDVFVMASKAETFGMVTIESMACGTPIIASNGGGSPEILRHGALGLLYAPMDASALAAALKEFLSDSQRVSSIDLEKAAQHYDHTKVCSEVERALGLFNY